MTGTKEGEVGYAITRMKNSGLSVLAGKDGDQAADSTAVSEWRMLSTPVV
jgi:hypothetical protein